MVASVRRLGLAVLLLSSTIFMACQESSSPTGIDGEMQTLAVTGVNGVLTAGQEATLTVRGRTATGGDADLNCNLQFSSSNEAVATVSATGQVEAKAPGSATITVRCNTITATTVVLVTDGTATAGLALSQNLAVLRQGDTLRVRATARTEGGVELEGVNASFQSSNNAVATVSSTGLVEARGQGTATITATYDGRTAVMVVTVVQVQGGQSITVDPPAATLTANGTVQLTATVRDANGTVVPNAQVTFSSSSDAVATVDGDGTVTAHATGTATITARSSGGASATATIAVVAQGSVGSVSITPPDLLLRVGGSADVDATVRDVQGTVMANANVVFSSDDPSVAIVTSTGLVIGQSTGQTTIRASSGGRTDVAVVTVVQLTGGQSITVDPPAATLTANGTVQLTATVRNTNGAVVPNAQVTFSSSNQAVATVNGTGLVTANAAGTATITARSSSGATATATIVVAGAGQVGSVTLTPPDVTVRVGGRATLDATVRDAQGNAMTNAQAAFTSDDPTIAIVSSTGVVTGVRAGQTTIRATAAGQSDTTVVTVVP